MSEYTELHDNLWVVFRKNQIQVYQESKWPRRCSLSSSCSLFALLTHFLSNPFARCNGTLSTCLSFLSFFGDKSFSFQPCGCHDRGPKTVSKVYTFLSFCVFVEVLVWNQFQLCRHSISVFSVFNSDCVQPAFSPNLANFGRNFYQTWLTFPGFPKMSSTYMKSLSTTSCCLIFIIIIVAPWASTIIIVTVIL